MKLKISRLFHWLYATLMFLPLVFFIPSCLYYSLNENATNTETTTINYKYESNEVNSLDDLVLGNIYTLNTQNHTVDEFLGASEYNELYFELLSDLNFENRLGADETVYQNDIVSNTLVCFNCFNYVSLNVDVTDYQSLYISFDATENLMLNDCIIRLLDYNFTVDYHYFSYTDFNEIESVTVNTDEIITNKINYAWNSVWDLPLFSWTKTSFVAAPFSYITSLFGLGSDNSLNYLFAYFASISICWLVFDLIMYVPNLAHRWLDRSAIE